MMSQTSIDTSPAVSVIVAVYNNPDYLEKVLLSLVRQTFRDVEVIIADDGSSESIKTLIETYTDRFEGSISHVWHPDQGFRKTIIANRAVLSARAPYLLFIDGDCLLHHRFIERHYIRRRPGRILSGRRVRMKEGITTALTHKDIQNGRFENKSFWWHDAIKTSRRHGTYRPFLFGVKNLLRRSYFILGSNYSVFKTDFLEINGYDERIIGRGLEDNNITARFTMAGFSIRTIAREALQYHMYHHFDPSPHSPEVVREFSFPSVAYTPFGIHKITELPTQQ